ncbi:hypothetical protein LL971_20305, partial [Xanthomonas campestris pv. parthenii]|nr:hypothetical protein [Xanthomonas campestris pv. parthenii]
PSAGAIVRPQRRRSCNYRLREGANQDDEWSVGANLLVQSGRPVNCFGYYIDPAASGYQNSYFFCDKGDGRGSQPSPRGSAGRTPWTRTLDLNVAYRPAFADGKLVVKVDIFNVTNEDKPLSVYEYGEDASGNPQQGGTDAQGNAYANIYGYPTSWQTPRSVRFMMQYSF